MPVIKPGREPRMMTIAYLMARETGDATTARRLERKLARWEESRFFNADGGDADRDEYGSFFGLGDAYPRGQESSLYILKHLLDGEGDWWRCFNEMDVEKFSAPTVTGVDYPSMGLSVAYNDPATATLHLQSYVATTSARGRATTFKIENLPDTGAVTVLRDGAQYGEWRASRANAIEITTDVGDHSYEIYTGYRGAMPAPGATATTPSTGGVERSIRVSNRTSITELAGAIGAVQSGAVGCPCCAG
jgi:hypothetical protein